MGPADLTRALFTSFPYGVFNWEPQQWLELSDELIFFQKVRYQCRSVGR